MKYNPYDYQKYSIDFIVDNKVCALLIDMGMGKSSVTLSTIDILIKNKKVLVIAPIRVAKTTWLDEIRKWDQLSNLTFSVAVGTKKERKNAFRRKADIYIINRENVE